ncbi:MAG: YggT family protein, partial [Pseudomonadota bacterium]
DVSALVVLVVLAFIKLWLIGQIVGAAPSLPGLLVSSVAEVVGLCLNVFFFSILIQVILSWLNQGGGYNPIVGVLHSLNEPLLRPARRIMPPLSGFDLSPIVVMIAIQLANILVVAPLRDVGRVLM